MTRSVYVVGGAGTGKSTFMAELLEALDPGDIGALVDLHSKRNAKANVTLRGHYLEMSVGHALYLGVLREGNHPGTDGLDRASGLTGEEWLETEAHLPPFILAEGATLATTRFLGALNRTTELMVILLTCDDEAEKARRFEQRGTTQKSSFVKSTATAAANRYAELEKEGARSLCVDSTDPAAWDVALGLAEAWVLGCWGR